MSAVATAAATAAAPTRYEAEAASATCDGTIDSNHSGFSGSGFCNAANEAGAAAQFTVTAPASGTATLGIRFANGATTTRPADLQVNGTTAQPVSFETTGAWNIWVTKTLTVAVNSGSNTIRLTSTGAEGLPNLDYLDLELTAQPSRHEAEDAPATCAGTIDSNHAGYSGTGFCNGPNEVGAAVQFTVTAPASGTATLGIRFANGATTTRPADLQVNGSTVQSVSFESTGAWGTWVTKTLSVSVNSGSNTIRLSPTIAAGLPNIDYLDFEVGSGSSGYAGYLFTYFTGENTSAGEQVYFALSQGNDPTRWRQLNGGRPVLTTTVGTRGVRDPFIIRSPQGDKFYQIATDLRIYGNGNWDAAQRHGSKSIVVWESTDLVNWSAPRLARVSPDTAGNTWAPEAYYDESLGQYVVFWASKLYSTSDPNHTATTYNRMMYATTSDFRTFSPAQVWVNKGYSTIDSTLIKHNGTYYRFTKDERSSSQSACGKFILAEKSTTILNRTYSFLAECIGRGAISQGEGPLIFKSNTAERWYLFIDEYGGRGYIPFTTTDLNSGQWSPVSSYTMPGRPRHGTVLPVTQAEYDRLLARWG